LERSGHARRSDPVLKRLRESRFWQTQSSEALCRTAIDLVLFERLEAHQEEAAARQLWLHGEAPVTSYCRQPNHIVSGEADYLLGYMPSYVVRGRPPYRFESSMVVVEAKREVTFEVGLAQAATYMIGIQQHRMSLIEPKRIVNTVYGMVSDGTNWQFLRLDSKVLLISLKFSCIVEAGRRKVYQFVDAIIQAAVASSPHTTPKTSFPATHQLWRRDIEAAVFGIPFSLAAYLRLPDSHYLVSDDEDVGDLEDMGELKIIRSETPTSSNVKLLPIRIATPSPVPPETPSPLACKG